MAERASLLCYLVHSTIYGDLVTQLNEYEHSVSHLVVDKKYVNPGVAVISITVEYGLAKLRLDGRERTVDTEMTQCQIDYGSVFLNLSKVSSKLIIAIKDLIHECQQPPIGVN